MKQSIISAVLILGALLLALYAYYDPQSAELTARSQIARAAVLDLQKSLKGELVQALRAGGPEQAIEVCHLSAPAIATAKSERFGMDIGRTALKVRNQSNAPDDFERRVLEDFLAKMSRGVEPGRLEHAEIFTGSDGKKVFRYMKPILMADKPCGACHGDSISAEVKAAIAERYPYDQAVGFKPGELRGAFTVTAESE